MRSSNRLRLRYSAVAVVTILVGLFVHMHGAPVLGNARDFIGDALWAFMMASLVSAAMPALSLAVRCALALLIAYGVEFSQLLHTSALDRVRHTFVGHLVLGSGFDPIDLAAYFAGVAAFALTLRRLLRQTPDDRNQGDRG